MASGEVARSGLTRGAARAGEHDLGWHEPSLPWGRVDEDRAPRRRPGGRSAKTRDGLGDGREAWGAVVEETEPVAMTRLQSTRDHGPARRGRRTQVRPRLVPCADPRGQPIPLLYAPPSQSTDHPSERCWGLVELPGPGTTWVEVETRLGWAKRMTWKGIHPVVALSRQGYPKGRTRGKKAMQALESRLARPPELPKGDRLIRPAAAWR